METDPNHLGMAELARLLEKAREGGANRVATAEMHPHLAGCESCREQFENLAELESEFRQGGQSAFAGSDCPEAKVWSEVAGGVSDPEGTPGYLRHASGCDHCGRLLRTATAELIGLNIDLNIDLNTDLNIDLNKDLTDAERAEIAGLKSSRPEWQLRLAERISGTLRRDTPPAWWRRWLAAPVLASAAVTIAVVAAVAWWAAAGRGTVGSANALLARAYTDQRTLELRIPGAAYAPLRVQRGPAESFVARPATLLKAEAMIASQLASHHDDPDWLQAAARADVLEGKYDAAVESLQRALELRPDSADLLLDLGTAHFQRAQSEDRHEDYGAAFEALSKVLTQQPDNATALFNRAIVAEHQFLYRQALEDWEHYLKVDARSEWSEEARSHAEAVRAKLQEHESGARPLLTPEQIAASGAASADLEARVEQYLDAAVRVWLPAAYPESGAGNAQAQQALFFLADLTAQKHQDRWLSDLLRGASAASFSKAASALARASQKNYSGDYTAGRAEADTAVRLFRGAGSRAGLLRAQFERAYAEQLTRRTDDCQRDANAALAEADGLPYSWLQIQLGLEKGVCSMLGQDDWGTDERVSRNAMGRAKESGYDGLYLRALYFVADDQIRNGDLPGGLKSVAAAEERYWSAQIPAFRAYNLYDLLATIPEFTARRPHLVMAICKEATALAEAGDNLLSRARGHSFAARAAAAASEPQAARQQFAEAARLFDLAGQTEASRGYLLENEIHAAQLDATMNQFDSGIARLTQIQDDIRSVTNKYLIEMFYATLGELELRSNHPVQAEQAFRPALESAEQRLSSLNSEGERLNWSKEAAPVYLGMAEAELVQGHGQESLEYLEWYLGAAGRSGKNSASGARAASAEPDAGWLAGRLPLLGGKTVLAYGALPDGLGVWAYDERGVTAQWIPLSDQHVQELAARFYDLASDPKSEMPALRRDSESLYRALIAPIEQRLEPGRTLMIEAEGWLAQVPFEALLDSTGHYLMERAAVVHSLGQNTDAELREARMITPELHALIVASEASPQAEGLVPLPDATAEADAVAGDFRSPTLLKASAATLSAVESELSGAAIFHFTGHSLAKPNGAALVLGTGRQPRESAALLNGSQLRRLNLHNLQLAVLSTCNTESANDGARGFSSIAEAFERAGVPRVVASRWAVDSAVTREFMESFYRNVLSGQPVSEAMRQASRAMMADPRTAHPYYWAAFSAYGRP